MVNFVNENGKKYIMVEAEGLPSTLIKIESTDNDTILSTCQKWLDALGLTGTEYKVSVVLH